MYDSCEMLAIPASELRRPETATAISAPIPAPLTSGHCTLHATSPTERSALACASRYAFAAA